MRYISFFAGIGGFEVAIQRVYGNKATCVGYSEIDPFALAEYARHYPNHKNMGDISKISKNDLDALGNVDLVVGGFPCSDLSSLKHVGRSGLDGKKSGLFWTLIKAIKWLLKNNPNMKIIIENNASMSHNWRDVITATLEKTFKKTVYCNLLDSRYWVVQRRRRYYWTLSEIPLPKKIDASLMPTMSKALEPIKDVMHLKVSEAIMNLHNSKYLYGNSGWFINLKKKKIENVDYNTRWKSVLSLSTNDYIKCVTTVRTHNLLLDTRRNNFIVRNFSKNELDNLFGFPKDYVHTTSPQRYQKLYGMSVVPDVIAHILRFL